MNHVIATILVEHPGPYDSDGPRDGETCADTYHGSRGMTLSPDDIVLLLNSVWDNRRYIAHAPIERERYVASENPTHWNVTLEERGSRSVANYVKSTHPDAKAAAEAEAARLNAECAVACVNAEPRHERVLVLVRRLTEAMLRGPYRAGEQEDLARHIETELETTDEDRSV